MKAGLTAIVCVVDRSGSMASMQEEAIGAFNTFLDDQKKCPGEARMTYTQFDDIYEIVHSDVPIHNFPKLTRETYQPRGFTALLDAVGKTINDVGARVAQTPEDQRPERVLVVIMTDGAENSSKEFSRERIQEMIQHQREKYSWEFVFLAAGPSAFHEATSLGLPQQNIVKYAADGQSHVQAVHALSCATQSYRSGGTPDWSGAPADPQV